MTEPQQDAIRRLAECRRFSGEPGEFWPRYLEALGLLVGAERGLLLLRDPAAGWKPFRQWPQGGGAFSMPLKLDGRDFALLAEAAEKDGAASLHSPGGGALSLAALDVAGAAEEGGGGRQCLAVLVLESTTAAEVAAAAGQLLHARDVAAQFQRGRAFDKSKGDVANFARVLDIAAHLDGQSRFGAACMALANESAAGFGLTRAAVAWQKGPYLRLKAISGMERFDPKMDAVQGMEACLEEAADQDSEVAFPPPEGSALITRAHAAFAAAQSAKFLASAPIRIDGKPAGGILAERADAPFSAADLAGLRVLADRVARRLDELHRSDRWWGARLAGWARDRAARLLGFEHTWWKVAGIAACLAVLALFLVRVNYRVEAEFIIRSDDLTHLPAPYEGYIKAVPARVGDQVAEGQVLVELDTSELFLEEASSLAQLQRYQSEAEKAENENRLADMRVAQAMRKQTQASLDLTRHRLAQAQVKAPFAGIIVAGDLRDRLGSPVKTGEIMMRLTRLEDLYIEMKVAERDIHEILDSADGEISFVSKPDQTFAFAIDRIEPAAVAEQGGNNFIARALPQNPAESWWRPGMTGVAKINVGDRTLFWIFTHRLVDFLRMKLWW